MTNSLAIPATLLSQIHADLSRPHAYAAERVGFIAAKAGMVSKQSILLATQYFPVADEHYVDTPTVGAMMSSAAIRTALEHAYAEPISMFHVHRHDHRGQPRFSRVDLNGYARFIPNFWHVRRELPHGAIVLSWDSAVGLCWEPGKAHVAPLACLTMHGSDANDLKRLDK